MAKMVRLDIVTPGKITFSEDVAMVIARATDGDIGILPGHAPMIAGLSIAPLRIIKDETEMQIAVCGGFVEVQPEKVTILAGCAELPEEIDVSRAQAALERAEQRIKAGSDVDVTRAELALRRALTRLKVAEISGKK